MTASIAADWAARMEAVVGGATISSGVVEFFFQTG